MTVAEENSTSHPSKGDDCPHPADLQHHNKHSSGEQNGNVDSHFKKLALVGPPKEDRAGSDRSNQIQEPLRQQGDLQEAEGSLASTPEIPDKGPGHVRLQRNSQHENERENRVSQTAPGESGPLNPISPPTQMEQDPSIPTATAGPRPASLTGPPTQVEEDSSSSVTASGHPIQVEPEGLDETRPAESPPTQVEEDSSSSVTASGHPTQVEPEGLDETSGTHSHKFVCKEISEDENLVDSLRLRLDKSHRVIKNHENLACSLHVPADIRAKCKLNTEYSPTEKLFDMLEASYPALKVAQLISALRSIGRKDVVLTIIESIPDAETSSEKVCDMVSNNFELVDAIATKLDETSRINKYWLHLGLELNLKKAQLDDLTSSTNPTLGLMEFIYDSHKPDMSVREFLQMMTDFNRQDVLSTLEILGDTSDQQMSQAIPLDSDCMAKICRSLNKCGQGLKGWKFVASAQKVPRKIYEDFNPKKLESPTKMLLKWLSTNRPDLTIDQLCDALGDIGRNDVVLLLKERFGLS